MEKRLNLGFKRDSHALIPSLNLGLTKGWSFANSLETDHKEKREFKKPPIVANKEEATAALILFEKKELGKITHKQFLDAIGPKPLEGELGPIRNRVTIKIK